MNMQSSLPVFTRRFFAFAAALTSVSFGSSAFARSTIREPNAHPNYHVELEPHLVFGPYDPPREPTGEGIGLGLRVTIPILENGFIPRINNSVGISFGFDWLHYWGDDQTLGACSRWTLGPGNTNICTEVGGQIGGESNYLMFPVAMQWNFWLTDKFSVFGEPGLTIYGEKGVYEHDSHIGVTPLFQVGGRFHFLPKTTLTLRIGYPTLSIGVSGLL
jgi:hypothetical protein